MEQEKSDTVLLKAIQGAKWVILSRVASKLIQPVVMIVLARLLAPEEFGLVAMAAVAVGVIGLFQDLGMGAALVQQQERVEETADVVFFTNLVLGICWYAILFALAPLIAAFFRSDPLTSILRVVALGLVIGPLTSVQGALMLKDFSFRPLFFLGLVPVIASACVSIGLAASGFGVWSLVYGPLVASIINTILIWVYIPWRPGRRYDLGIAKRVLGFGGYVSLENVLVWGFTTIDNIFVGRFLGARQLGIYQMGFNLGLWTAANITGSLGGVLYPTFSRLQHDREECKRLYLRVVRLIAIMAIPVGLIIAMCADRMIPFLFGDPWRPAVPVAQILSVVGIMASIVSVAPIVYKAMGRADIMPKFFAVRLVVSVPAYYYAVQGGLVHLAIAHLVLVLIFAPINFYIATRFLDVSWKEGVDLFRLPVVSSALMGGVLWVMIGSLPIQANVVADGMSILSTILLAVLVYVLSLKWLEGQTFMELKKMVRVALT